MRAPTITFHALPIPPVIAHPPMARFWGEMENASRATPPKLRDAGIRFAFQSGYESYVPKSRVVLFEAAVGAAHGLGFDAALRAITLDAAAIARELVAGREPDPILLQSLGELENHLATHVLQQMRTGKEKKAIEEIVRIYALAQKKK